MRASVLLLGPIAAVVLASGCESGTRRPGSLPGSRGSGTQSPRDAGAAADSGEGAWDSGLPPGVDGGFPPGFDAGFPPGTDAGFPPREDSGVPFWDAGFPPVPDAGFRVDAGFPPRDAGFPDSGVRFDAGFPPRDAGSGADAGPPDSGIFNATSVDFSGGSALTIDTQAVRLSYEGHLVFDNPRGTSEQLEIQSAVVVSPLGDIPITLSPSVHSAPPGRSTLIVRYTSMGGMPLPFPISLEQLLCLFPIPVEVRLGISNGQTISEFVSPTCL